MFSARSFIVTLDLCLHLACLAQRGRGPAWNRGEVSHGEPHPQAAGPPVAPALLSQAASPLCLLRAHAEDTQGTAQQPLVLAGKPSLRDSQNPPHVALGDPVVPRLAPCSRNPYGGASEDRHVTLSPAPALLLCALYLGLLPKTSLLASAARKDFKVHGSFLLLLCTHGETEAERTGLAQSHTASRNREQARMGPCLPLRQRGPSPLKRPCQLRADWAPWCQPSVEPGNTQSVWFGFEATLP